MHLSRPPPQPKFVSRSMLNMYLHKSHKGKEVNVVRRMHYASAVSALPNLPLLALLASVFIISIYRPVIQTAVYSADLCKRWDKKFK